MARSTTRTPWQYVLALLACTASVAACAGPQTGTWSGSAEVAPSPTAQAAIWTVQLHCGKAADDSESCRVDLQPPGKPVEQLPACRFVRTGRAAELTVDPGRPGCDGPAAERLTLQGTVGEGVWFGEVRRGGQRVGQFRAYWTP
jgi:hypothetical protein